MTPDEVAAVLADHKVLHDACSECSCATCGYHWPCLPYRLASLASEQAAALARMEEWAASAERGGWVEAGSDIRATLSGKQQATPEGCTCENCEAART